MRHTPNSRTVPINVVGGSSFGRYNKISSAKTYNMFISTAGEADNIDAWLVNFAGYKRAYDLLPSGTGRGIFHSLRGNILVIVVNGSVYRVDKNLIPTLIGTMASLSGEVFIDENLNNQIVIVDGTNTIYIYNHSLAANLTPQVLPFPVNYICYHNTYFLFGNGDTTGNGALWYAYSFDTPTSITQTTALALQTKPDYAIAIVRLPGQGNNVFVFGNSVCEIWTQVGGLQNYRRNSTINVDYGCISVSTIASSDKYVAWLAANENNAPTIMVYTGQGVSPISSDGIDYVLSQIKFPKQSTAMFYRQDGHLFYQLTFYNPLDNLTLVYDFTTQKFFHLSDQHLNYHPARNYVYFNNQTFFISLNNAAIYNSSTDITVINESTAPTGDALTYDIQRIRICDSIRNQDSARFLANSLVLTLEQGCDEKVSALSLMDNQDFIITEAAPTADLVTEFGSIIVLENGFTPIEDEIPALIPDYLPGDILLTEYGLDIVDEDTGIAINDIEYTIPYQPRVDLSLSQDGGITWSNTVSRSLNPIGFRRNILTWEKMGQANDLTCKFRFWGQSRFIVNQAYMQVYP